MSALALLISAIVISTFSGIIRYMLRGNHHQRHCIETPTTKDNGQSPEKGKINFLNCAKPPLIRRRERDKKQQRENFCVTKQIANIIHMYVCTSMFVDGEKSAQSQVRRLSEQERNRDLGPLTMRLNIFFFFPLEKKRKSYEKRKTCVHVPNVREIYCRGNLSLNNASRSVFVSCCTARPMISSTVELGNGNYASRCV